jgi:hypothetical protein
LQGKIRRQKLIDNTNSGRLHSVCRVVRLDGNAVGIEEKTDIQGTGRPDQPVALDGVHISLHRAEVLLLPFVVHVIIEHDEQAERAGGIGQIQPAVAGQLDSTLR